MIRILKLIFTGDWHLHKWDTIKEVEVRGDAGSLGTRYYCECKICGKHKKFN